MLPLEAKEHLEKYWSLCRRFFEESEYALAAFFAITLIEEVGKVIILGNKNLTGKLEKKALHNHRRKYIYAVYYTIMRNSRITRIYKEKEKKFAKWFKKDKLMDIRNQALYLELTGSSYSVPHMRISREDAFLLVCIAGEVYGEIQGFYSGTGPKEWERIIEEVDNLRKKYV